MTDAPIASSGYFEAPEKLCNHCDVEECLGFCTLLKELDDEVLKFKAFGDDFSIVKTLLLDGELESEEKLAKEGKNPGNNAASANKSDTEAAAAEKKNNREQKRRNDVNKGLDKLMELVFVIDPQIKERSSNTPGGSKKLNRVELVRCIVTTLARIFEENEIRKIEINRLARERARRNEDGGTSAKPMPALYSAVSLPPSFFEADASAMYAQAEEQSTTESIAEKRRKREKKRRDGVSSGLDKLAELVFLIDPQLKAAALARAMSKNHTGGSPAVAETRLLGRVELVNAAVATLARVHRDNQIHKLVIAHVTGTSYHPLPSSLQEIMVALGLLENDETTESKNRISDDSMEPAILEQAPTVEVHWQSNPPPIAGTEEDGPVKKKVKI